MTVQCEEYVVVRAKNKHDAMTVRCPDRNSTFQIVECDGEAAGDLLDEVDIGDVVSLELRRVGRRGNAWCVAEATPIDEEVTPTGRYPHIDVGNIDPVDEDPELNVEDVDPVNGSC